MNCELRCVLLDSNVYDLLAADTAFLALVRASERGGRIRVLSTTVQIDELRAIPAHKDIGQNDLVAKAARMGTPVFVLDVSRLDIDKLGTDEAHADFERLLTPSLSNAYDSLLGATALHGADILVTNDDRFARRLKSLGGRCQVMSPSEFRAFLTG